METISRLVKNHMKKKIPQKVLVVNVLHIFSFLRTAPVIIYLYRAHYEVGTDIIVTKVYRYAFHLS